MRKFETQVQYLKYRVIKEIVYFYKHNKMDQAYLEIPKSIIPGPKASFRCCIYKERAIIGERMKLAMGGNQENDNVIEVIDVACEECPLGGYEVSAACRGCIAHRCMEVCPKDAIILDSGQKAHIDKNKCVKCGLCAKSCPYSAIINYQRPCEAACSVKAISNKADRVAQIDNKKCIACGACVYQCPFGAISEKSSVIDVLNLLKNSNYNQDYQVYAIVAPSIAVQFVEEPLLKVFTALKKVGFEKIYEAAQGADMVATKEAEELMESNQLLTSSCCPAFVSYIKKTFPKLSLNISHNLSPMAELAKKIKQENSNCKIVFIGPCTAKKMEIKLDTVSPYVDAVLTFEELEAMLDGWEINITTLEETQLNDATYFGRNFAKSGGVSEAINQAVKKQAKTSFNYKPIICNGIDECRNTLLKAMGNNFNYNFIEGMACVGGCIGGPCNLNRSPKNMSKLEKYSQDASKKV